MLEKGRAEAEHQEKQQQRTDEDAGLHRGVDEERRGIPARRDVEAGGIAEKGREEARRLPDAAADQEDEADQRRHDAGEDRRLLGGGGIAALLRIPNLLLG